MIRLFQEKNPITRDIYHPNLPIVNLIRTASYLMTVIYQGQFTMLLKLTREQNLANWRGFLAKKAISLNLTSGMPIQGDWTQCWCVVMMVARVHLLKRAICVIIWEFILERLHISAHSVRNLLSRRLSYINTSSQPPTKESKGRLGLSWGRSDCF